MDDNKGYYEGRVIALEEVRRDYLYYDRQSGDGHNRRCIDKRLTGSGKCVGYCQNPEHRGFLTRELRREHDCLGKKCFYYLQKPKRRQA